MNMNMMMMMAMNMMVLIMMIMSTNKHDDDDCDVDDLISSSATASDDLVSWSRSAVVSFFRAIIAA